jgi:hypothetical protein
MTEVKDHELESEMRNVEYTISLTEAAESEAISPNEYARRRAGIVGEGNILEYIIIPLIVGIWHHLFPPHAPNQALAKSKSG